MEHIISTFTGRYAQYALGIRADAMFLRRYKPKQTAGKGYKQIVFGYDDFHSLTDTLPPALQLLDAGAVKAGMDVLPTHYGDIIVGTMPYVYKRSLALSLRQHGGFGVERERAHAFYTWLIGHAALVDKLAEVMVPNLRLG